MENGATPKGVVYIAGKMTGLPDKGRNQFFLAQAALEDDGWIVLNPASLPDGLPANSYIPICLAMLSAASVVMLLPGWERSRGAQIEAHYAMYQNIPVREIESLIPIRVRQVTQAVEKEAK